MDRRNSVSGSGVVTLAGVRSGYATTKDMGSRQDHNATVAQTRNWPGLGWKDV